MKRLAIHVLAFWLVATATSLCAVIPSVDSPGRPGRTPTAENWNDSVVGIYSYINDTVVDAMNALTAKGDIYARNANSLTALTVGSNDQILQADSTQTTGSKWSTFTGTAPLTTKGDLVVVTASGAATRLPVGANGAALLADSSVDAGVRWVDLATLSDMPVGACITWSPDQAGSDTIPTGYVLCDGTNGTPNLIGMFVVGTRPNGDTSSASVGGYGAQTVDQVGNGAISHHHVATLSGAETGGPDGISQVAAGVGALAPGPGHGCTVPSTGSATGDADNLPTAYALVYIMKQ